MFKKMTFAYNKKKILTPCLLFALLFLFPACSSLTKTDTDSTVQDVPAKPDYLVNSGESDTNESSFESDSTNSLSESDTLHSVPFWETLLPIENELLFNDASMLESGSFQNGIPCENQDFIRISAFFPVEAIKTLELQAGDVHTRVIVNEYDSDYRYLKSTDLSTWAHLLIDSNTSYLTVSVYKYRNSRTVKTDYDTFLQELLQDELLKLVSVNEEDYLYNPEFKMSGELKGDDICNPGIYMKGFFSQYDHRYNERDYYDESRILYEISPDSSYFFDTNESRLSINMYQYDESGKYLYQAGNQILTNGSEWNSTFDTVQYIRVSSSMAGSSHFNSFFDCGLWCNWGQESVPFSVEHIAINDFDFSRLENYRAGAYTFIWQNDDLYHDAGFCTSASSFCAGYYLDLNGDYSSRRIRTYDATVKMQIQEYDDNGILVQSFDYQNGRLWTPADTTSYITVTLVSSLENATPSTFEKLFLTDENKVSLSSRKKYAYNTDMKIMTAAEWVSQCNVGINIGNSLDSYYGEWDKSSNDYISQETTFGNVYLSEEYIDFLASMGFQTIRIPVTWQYNTYQDVSGHYHINEQLLDRVQDVVDYAISRGLYVLLNTHFDAGKPSSEIRLEATGDELSDIETYCRDIWTEIAEYFKDYDEHLSFESYNEVGCINHSFVNCSPGNEQMNLINQIFVDAVRSTGGNNTYRVLEIQTYSALFNSQILKEFKMPVDPSGQGYIAIQVHCYPNDYDQLVENRLSVLDQFARKFQAPIVIGEFGIKNNYPIPRYQVAMYSNFIARCKNHGILVYVWDDGNLTADGSFGIIDRIHFENSEMDILNGIMNPVAYVSPNITTFTSMDSFLWKTVNQTTGEVIDDIYWGSIITDIDGHGIPIPSGCDYILAGVTTNTELAACANQKVQYIHFYDQDMNLIVAYNSGNSAYREVPKNAAYIRIGINSSYNATSKESFETYFETGQLSAYVKWIDLDDPDGIIQATQ